LKPTGYKKIRMSPIYDPLAVQYFLPNYFDDSAAEKVQIVNGRQHWEQEHPAGSVFADLLQDPCHRGEPNFMFSIPQARQF
jgi:hypothetical protein